MSSFSIINYVKEFNKIVHDISFFSSSHDISLSNKLILIQQDLTNTQFNFDSFEIYNFYSNIFNILNLSSDVNSILIKSCMDVLLTTSTVSRNISLIRAMNFVNFLPAIIKLILSVQDGNEEKMIKLLTLVKNLIRSSHSELDEHNTKLIIEVLRDCVENTRNDSTISKLSFNILSDLIMKNVTARHQVMRILNSSKLGDKVNKSCDLIGLKFLVVIADKVTPKDFTHLITLSLKGIREGILSFDIEPVLHSLDLLDYAENTKMDRSICEENLKYLDDLNKSLISALQNEPESSMAKDEFFSHLFAFYNVLIKLDKNVTSEMEFFVKETFKYSNFLQSEKALEFLRIFIKNSGKISKSLIESVIEKFNENEHDEENITCREKSAFLKFLQVCLGAGYLEDNHINAISAFITNIIGTYEVEATKIHEADQDFIFLIIHLIQTLELMSNHFNIFREKLKEILSHEYIPIVLARAYETKDKEILMNLMTFGHIDYYPTEKVARLLSKSHQGVIFDEKKNQERQREAFSSSSKYINRIMGSELNTLINRINEKLDNNELDSLKSSDMIALYRHKNNYFNDHLNALNASLEKYTDLCQELQHQNSVLRKMGETQELVNWCLEMDKENLQKENQALFNDQKSLKSSVATFQSKITKENQAKTHAQKVLKMKELENEKLLKERNEIEVKHQNEKKNLKLAQIENEKRIEQLKCSLEEERKLKAGEIAEAVGEQKKIAQKLKNSEKENEKLQDVIKLNENELTLKQARIVQLENDLKEAEKIQSSIMSIMSRTKSTLK